MAMWWLQMGDEIVLVGYPDAHAVLDPSFRNGKEVFDAICLICAS